MKPKSKRKTASNSNRKKATNPNHAGSPAAQKTPVPKSSARPMAGRQPQASTQKAIRTESKLARVIAMLRAPTGATISTIMQATGWQQHSVRGFFAGVVRKKLGLNLMSEAGESGRVYRIVPADAKTNEAA